jgi:hypothetical protein
MLRCALSCFPAPRMSCPHGRRGRAIGFAAQDVWPRARRTGPSDLQCPA